MHEATPHERKMLYTRSLTAISKLLAGTAFLTRHLARD
jgi:hypothetical protein